MDATVSGVGIPANEIPKCDTHGGEIYYTLRLPVLSLSPAYYSPFFVTTRLYRLLLQRWRYSNIDSYVSKVPFIPTI